jgi:hypothetical protein
MCEMANRQTRAVAGSVECHSARCPCALPVVGLDLELRFIRAASPLMSYVASVLRALAMRPATKPVSSF